MSNCVYWLLELQIQAGREKDFQVLMKDMVGAVQANEPGTLTYEWTTSADGKLCHIYERYTDSAAVMTHLGNFGQKFAGRFMEVFKPVRFTVYGSPSQDVKNALAGFNPVYMKPAGGFSR